MSLKVLLVSHNFLPRHRAGTEVYTWQLGRELMGRGHRVHVFTTEKEISAPNLSVRRREVDGLGVSELINNLIYGDFEETYRLPGAEKAFADVLEEFRPDVVHIQHLMNLSCGLPRMAREFGARVVFTLHDYWLQCARFGQRVHGDGSVCHRIEVPRCAGCLSEFKWRQGETERRVSQVAAGIRRGTGLDLGPMLVKTANRFRGKGRGGGDAPEDVRGDGDRAETNSPFVATPAFEASVGQRERAIRSEVIPHVQRFLSPSRFLRERFVEWGLPAERIEYRRIGVDLDRFGSVERGPSDRPRIAFLGTLSPLKGPDVLVEAWGRLDPGLRARGRLRLYGPGEHYPGFVRELHRRALEVGAELPGSLDRGDVAKALAEIDLLVVPSVWYENSPLSILEGRAAGIPLLVSDLGGMAELVREGRDGERFPAGDAAALAELLGGFLEHPERLAKYAPSLEGIPNVAEDADAVLAVYEELLGGSLSP